MPREEEENWTDVTLLTAAPRGPRVSSCVSLAASLSLMVSGLLYARGGAGGTDTCPGSPGGWPGAGQRDSMNTPSGGNLRFTPLSLASQTEEMRLLTPRVLRPQGGQFAEVGGRVELEPYIPGRGQGAGRREVTMVHMCVYVCMLQTLNLAHSFSASAAPCTPGGTP